MENDKLPTRKSVRASWHDYNCGFYFITVCTHQKVHSLGRITSGEMHLSSIGKRLENGIAQIEQRHENVAIINQVIMPNHFHLILKVGLPIEGQWNEGRADHNHSKLSKIITGIKAYVTKYCNDSGIKFAWQRSFHEKIITSAPAFSHIMDYVDNNINRWSEQKD